MVVVAIVVFVVISNSASVKKIVDNKPLTSIKTYTIKNLGVNFNYPGSFNVLEQIGQDNASSTTLVLSSGKNQILFIVAKKSRSDAEKDKVDIEKRLAKDSRSGKSTEKIRVGDFYGYKFLIDFEKSGYSLFKDLDGSSLVIQSEINAPSNRELTDLEDILRSMITSVVSK